MLLDPFYALNAVYLHWKSHSILIHVLLVGVGCSTDIKIGFLKKTCRLHFTFPLICKKKKKKSNNFFFLFVSKCNNLEGNKI